MTAHRIVSVEMGKIRAAGHETVIAVRTNEDSGETDRRWTALAVLKAMNTAERFFTQAANGRQARVQRYSCATCRSEHIRTHLSDGAIDDMRLHRVS